MSAVRSCPKCSSRVAAPWGAADEQWVRCPLCGAEFRLGEVLAFDPPALVLIDEPAVPAEGKLPQWGAVAAPAADANNALAATELATPTGNLPEIEVIAPPPMALADVATSDAADDDSEVITFDDSLLLDEPTDALPGQATLALPSGLPRATPMSDDDLFKTISPEAVSDFGEPASELDWPEDGEPQPFEFEQDVATAGPLEEIETDIDRQAEPHETVAEFNAAPLTDIAKSGDFGLPPRRRSRHGNPITMLVGYIGGGVLGLAIGYAILMWGFSRDPFDLGRKLPDVLVPAALRSANNPRVAQYGPSGESKSGSESNADHRADSGEPAGSLDDEPLFPPPPAPATPDAADNSFSPGAADSNDAASSGTSTNQSAIADGTVPPNPFDLPTAPAAPSSAPPDDPNAQKSSTPTTADHEGKSQTDAAPNGPAPTVAAPTTAAPADEAPTDAAATAEPERAATFPPALADAEVGPTAKRHYLVDDLLAAIQAAQPTTQAAVTLPADAPADRKLEVKGYFYTNLSKIAEALAHLNRDADPMAREKALDAAIAAFLDAAPTSQQLNELGKLGGYWYDNPSGNGIVLVGTVKQSRPAGKLVESVVEPLGGQRSVKPRAITVVSPAPLTDGENRVVLVAGTIVNRPAENIRGYEGAAKRAVWGAMAIDPLASRGNK